MNYPNREAEVRATISKEEAIRLIKEVYQANYDPDNPNFDIYDQLLACEAVAKANPIKQDYYKERENENVSVKWNGSDSSKRRVNFELTKSKLQVINELKTLNYRTPPIKIAQLLEELFREWNSQSTHWTYIAQQWPPRPINRVIQRMIKLHSSGRMTFKNPAAYFTHLIKFRKKRRGL